MELPNVRMLGQSGLSWVEPEDDEMIPLPEGASLVNIPGFYPVGLNSAEDIVVYEGMSDKSSRQVSAVAALLPQGFTRTLLPACSSPDGAIMPILGFAAVALKDDQIYVAAVQSDEHLRWHPQYYNTADLIDRITRMRNSYPQNRILKQLARCASYYGCFTAQNIFYQRWEGGIPTSSACNANCIACISESHLPVESPQERLQFEPTVAEIVEIGLHHLKGSDSAIVSFGQGCEGEPALNARRLGPAIRQMRDETGKGTINCNSNAGYTAGIMQMIDDGLEALRVTMFSAREGPYTYYHQPRDYALEDVKRSIAYAREKDVYVSLNLLVFPGYTDREAEIESLLELIKKSDVNMVQLRNLNIDPGILLNGLPREGHGIGINAFIECLRKEVPKVKVGSYSHPLKD